MPQSFDGPRSLAVHQEEIEEISLHSFGDASVNEVAACVYAVVCQASGTNQGLIAARSRLSKKRVDHPTARACSEFHGRKPFIKRKRRSRRIIHNRHALLARQLRSIVSDKRARRIQTLCIKPRSKNQQSSLSHMALRPHRTEPS